LFSCGCATKHFYPAYDERLPAPCGVPEEVYNDGLSPEQEDEWERVLEEIGRVPFIVYPNICARCGCLWPQMFRVADEEWRRYVEPFMRDQMLCVPCYLWIKAVIDDADVDP